MTLHDYTVLKKANDKYEDILDEDGFTPEAENLLDTMVKYCRERDISSEEFNKYFS